MISFSEPCTFTVHSHFYSFRSLSLYPAYNRVGRGNLVHSLFHFSLNFSSCCVLSGGTFTLMSEQRIENINFNKYFISSSGNQTHDQLQLPSHTCTTTDHFIYLAIGDEFAKSFFYSISKVLQDYRHFNL